MATPKLMCENRKADRKFCDREADVLGLWWEPGGGDPAIEWFCLMYCNYCAMGLKRDRTKSVRILPLSAVSYSHDMEEQKSE